MSVNRTIAFVDLAGFTALTDVHGDEAAVHLVDDFTAIAREAATGAGAELVKSVGDAVMLAGPSPAIGLDAVLRLFHAAYELDGFPEPRAGIHHGPVVERGGDYFGATVNLAARVASRAGSGQALVTGSQGRGAVASPFPHPPFNPYERFSRIRLTDGLLDMVTQPSGSGRCP